ncbi:EamA family transporter [bacterium]|nr:EamA family transporter [bacterium]
MAKRKYLSLAAYVCVSIAWGTTYAGIKVATTAFPPLTLAAIRFVFAGAALMVALRCFGIQFPSRRDWLRLAPVGCLLLCCANVLVAWAQQHVDSVFAALMVNSAPLIFAGLSAFAGERVPRLAWAGLAVGFMGLFVIVYPDVREALGGGHTAGESVRGPMFWWAMGALVLSPLSWALGSFIAKRYRPGTHPLMTAAAQSLAGGVAAAIVCTLSGSWQVREISPAAIGAVIHLIVVGSWLGYVSYMYVVMTLPADVAGTTTYLNTVVALAVGVLLLNERVTPWMVGGGAVVLLGVAVVNYTMARATLLSRERVPVKDGGPKQG